MFRAVLARNVKEMMNRRYAGSRNRPKSLAEDAGVTLSTVQRVLSCELGTSIDTIEALAAAFDTQPYQLLLPSEGVRRKFEMSESSLTGETGRRYQGDHERQQRHTRGRG